MVRAHTVPFLKSRTVVAIGGSIVGISRLRCALWVIWGPKGPTTSDKAGGLVLDRFHIDLAVHGRTGAPILGLKAHARTARWNPV